MGDNSPAPNSNEIAGVIVLAVLSGALFFSNDLDGSPRYGVSGVLMIALLLAVYKVTSNLFRSPRKGD